MKDNKILILGGKPISSCDIVNYAKFQGAFTVVTDYLPASQSPAKRIADEAWDISTSEVELLCNKIKDNHINAVFTGVHEYNIDKVIKICQSLSLPFYASFEAYAKLSNKEIYKQLFKDAGLPAIKEYYKGRAIDFHYSDCSYPLIVKPVDGSSGVGVKICSKEEELRLSVALAGEASNVGHVIVEEYMDAPELTIFYIARNGKILLSAMADRETQHFCKGVIPLPVMYRFPSVHLRDYESRFNKKVISVLSEIGVCDGMVFMQAFWRNGDVYIYDVGYRLTGTQEYNLLSYICGYNPLEMMVDYAMTGKMGNQDIEKLVDPYLNGKFAGIVTCLMMPGTIKEFVGVHEIEHTDGVIKFLLNHEVGETVSMDRLGTLGQIVARAFVVVDEKDQLEFVRKKVLSSLKVIDVNGNDLLIR